MNEKKFISLVRRVECLITENPLLYYGNLQEAVSGEDFWKRVLGFVPEMDSFRAKIHRFGSRYVLRCSFRRPDGSEFLLYPNLGGASLKEVERRYLEKLRPLGEFSSPEELEMWLDSIRGE